MSRPTTATATAAVWRPRATASRLLLQADGLVVSAAGALLLVRARPLASALGLMASWPLVVLGAAFVPYGAWLCWAATRASGARLRRLVGTIAVANTAWALVSAALLLGHIPTLTELGRWVVAVQAGVVALFAATEACSSRWTA